MAFFINTSKVGEVSDSINSLATKADSILSNISGYDVSCEGGFDFSGAKAAIENNIKGTTTKLKNTVALLTAVINAHGGIQNSVGNGGSTSGTTSGSTSSGSSNGCSSRGCATKGCGGCGSSGTSAPATVIATTAPATGYSAIQELAPTTLSTGADTSVGISTLVKVDDVLKTIDVKEITVDDIEKETNGKNTIIVEGIASSKECADYLVTVSEVTKDYDVSVKYIRLDRIIEDPNEATAQVISTASDFVNMRKEQVIDLYNSNPNHRRAYHVQYSDAWCATFTSAVLIKAGYGNYTNIIDPGVGNVKRGFEELGMYQEAKADTIPEPGSVIILRDLSDGGLSHVGIVESVSEDGTINTIEGNYNGSKVVRVHERKVGHPSIVGYGVLKNPQSTSSKTEIKDQKAYDKLISLNSTSEIKLKDTPITIIIKDDKVVNSLQGVASNVILEAAIKAAGIMKKSKAVEI